MRVCVCIRQGLDGEINPFDACAYEQALRIDGAEITLVSMGPASVYDFLLDLTRRGATEAVLLCDKAFAGSDTLATAYVLSLAMKRLCPDLVICGRQTLIGDTAQTGVMLSALAKMNVITNVMEVRSLTDERIACLTRDEGELEVKLPALITVERINTLRLPRLRSKLGKISVWNAEDIGADVSRCGLSGSPTRVIKTFENSSGKRKCKFITREMLDTVIAEARIKVLGDEVETKGGGERLPCMCIVGEAPREYALTVSDNIVKIDLGDAEAVAEEIKRINPDAVLWASDTISKRLSAQVAAKLGLGLCADCTRLECEGGELMMYRPALSGSVMAKIKSLTMPAMATVRTCDGDVADVLVGVGFGVRGDVERVRAFAKELGAQLCASRKMVDNGYLPYDMQVGITGKTVSPPLYIAIGISGAVHHVMGMQRAGTVIAINPDKYAPIFEYADYGIIDEF